MENTFFKASMSPFEEQAGPLENSRAQGLGRQAHATTLKGAEGLWHIGSPPVVVLCVHSYCIVGETKEPAASCPGLADTW